MIYAIIQARTGSTRFPGKVLKEVQDKTILRHIVERVDKCKVDKIIVATTNHEEDLYILKNYEDNIYYGSQDDLLDRYYNAAKYFGVKKGDHILRITADCPCLDIGIVNQLIDSHLQWGNDITKWGTTIPDGMDCCIFTFEKLKEAFENAKKESEREHVWPYIWDNTTKRGELVWPCKLPDLRLTLDYPDDLTMIQMIYAELYGVNHYFGLSHILELYKVKPEIFRHTHIRDEKFIDQVKQEAKIERKKKK